MNKNESIKAILEGRVSAPESRQLLNGIEPGDMEGFLKDGENKRAFEAYKKNQPVRHQPVGALTDARIDEMWSNILAKSRDGRTLLIHQSGKRGAWLFGIFKETWGGRPLFQAVLVCSLVLVVSLTVIHFGKNGNITDYVGMKGDISSGDTLEYAILNDKGTLTRPDRELTEEDTLAFRVTVKHQGYVSIGVCHDQACDWVVSNRQLDQGIHDLREAYVLSGNRGDNTLVLISSNKAININDHQRYILGQAHGKDPQRVIIDDSAVSITFQQITVRGN